MDHDGNDSVSCQSLRWSRNYNLTDWPISSRADECIGFPSGHLGFNSSDKSSIIAIHHLPILKKYVYCQTTLHIFLLIKIIKLMIPEFSQVLWLYVMIEFVCFRPEWTSTPHMVQWTMTMTTLCNKQSYT